MIDLEDRLGSVLDQAAGSISPRPFEPERPVAIARRRRRNRLVVRAAGVLVALAGIGVVLGQARGEQVEAAGITYDEDGVPVSTGPALEWTPVTDLQGSAHDVIWTGQRFVAVVGDQTPVLYASDDGENWEPLTNQPPGPLFWLNLTAQGDSLLAWGPTGDADVGNIEFRPTSESVYRSRDHGETWELVAEIDSTAVDDDPNDYVHAFQAIVDAAAAGDTVVALAVEIAEPDIERILLDEGIIEADAVVESYGFDSSGENTGTVFYCEAEPGVGTDATALLAGCDEMQEVEVEGDWVSSVWEDGAVLLTSQNGGPFEPASEVDGFAYDLDYVDGRFLSFVAPGVQSNGQFIDEQQLLVSEDGVDWAPSDLFDSTSSIHGLHSDGSRVVAMGTADDGQPIIAVSTDGGQTWEASPSAVYGDMSVGAGGMLAVGSAYSPPRSVAGEIIALVLSGGAPSSEPELIGWSSDGEAWNWQPTADVFGEAGFPVVAVGQDQAVALVLGGSGTAVFVAELN